AGLALALVEAVGPLDLAGRWIDGHDRPSRAGGRIQHALDHDRRAFEFRFGTRTEVIGLESPRDFELAEVGAINLIERRVLRAAEIRGVHRPLAILGARHPAGLSGHEWCDPRVDRD